MCLRFVRPTHDRCSNNSGMGCHSVERPLVDALPIGVATLRSALRIVLIVIALLRLALYAKLPVVNLGNQLARR